MLPSRGLRPAQFAPSASRQCILARSSASRKFSSLPRTSGLAAPLSRTSPLQSARWRTGATVTPNTVSTASSVRYGSWYAPWSWGKSTAPGGPTESVPIAEFSRLHTSNQSQPEAVTTATPEIAPAGIDKAAVVDRAGSKVAETVDNASNAVKDSVSGVTENMALSDSKSIEDLLLDEPVKTVVEFDPTRLIDHAGHLKELGLDYGWGMTATFEKMIETVYLSSGFGWSGSIIVAGVVVRCFTFFFQAKASDKLAGMAALKPITEPITQKMEAALAAGDKAKADMYKMQQAQIMRPYVGGMASTAGFMLIQAWIGISAFRCLRAMGELPVPGLTSGGYLWFADLTVRDPYFLLPAATTAIMYTVFKSGGETGIASDAPGQPLPRKTIMNVMAGLIGLVTAFQPAILQLYFVVSGLLGACTGWLLRQNKFRRLIRIRPTPTKEAQALYSKVAAGELSLQDIKRPDAKLRYQAPKPTTRPSAIRGINIKAGTVLPAHLQAPPTTKVDKVNPDRDVDYDAPPTGMAKLDWIRRNYKPSFLWRRTKEGMDGMMRKAGYGGPKLTPKQAKKKKDAEMYEIERRRRFENRK